MAKQRLDKVLGQTGRWSRKEARELIRRGLVTVDGAVIRQPEYKAEPGAGGHYGERRGADLEAVLLPDAE